MTTIMAVQHWIFRNLTPWILAGQFLDLYIPHVSHCILRGVGITRLIISKGSNTFINVPVTWGGTLYQDCIQWELQPVEDHTSLDG